MLTGKAKEEFLTWYVKQTIQGSDVNKYGFHPETILNTVHLSMQYGVYVDFFDSVGIYIEIMLDEFNGSLADYYCYDLLGQGTNTEIYTEQIPSRHQAREEAIKKANEIYNKL